MADVVLGIAIVAATYLGSAVFAIVLFRIFFPLKKKDAKQLRLNYSFTENKSSRASSKNRVQLLSVSGRRDWLKVSS